MSTPRYFGPRERPLFGWLHPASAPNGTTRKVGVVIASPFGYEAICAHRSLRHLAARAAETGFPSLRFDYDGAGDSAGDDRDPDRVGAWIGSIHAACEELKAVADVHEVALVGIRLGALLAAVAATQRDDVAALVALAPVISGRRYVRELKILQGALDLSPPPAGVEPEEGLHEALGFPLTEQTKKALGALDVAALDLTNVPEVMVLDRNDLPGAEAWIERLKEQGVDVVGRTAPGYVEMMLDPHRATVPKLMFAEAVAWLERVCLARRPAAEPGAAEVGAAEVGAAETTCLVDGVRESVHVLDRGVVGIMSEPADGGTSGRGIVLLNAGSVHRVGPNRLYTRLARRWARGGDLVFRCDVTGIGDSPPRAGQPENVVYGPHAVDDVRSAVSWLRQRRGIRRVDAVGLCSGAYHALKAAVAEAPIDGVVSINPLTFFYDESEPLDARAHKVAAAARRYGTSVRDVEKWRKVLRGEVDLEATTRILWRRAGTLVTRRARDVRRALGRPAERDLGAELELCARRGVPVRFVFAREDPGRDLLQDEGGSAVPKLLATDMLDMRVIDGPDHTFTPLWSHELFAEAVRQALDDIERARR